MSSVPVFVGIDYHQDSVQVCVLDGSGRRLANRSLENSAAIVAQVATQFGQPTRVAIEACCGAAAQMLQRGKPKNVVIAAVANRFVRWLYYELKREPPMAQETYQPTGS